jgi:hypothetical protein
MCCSHCSPENISSRTLYICLPFLTFQMLAFRYPFLCSYFQSYIYECFVFSSCSFKMNKKIVEYLQGISLSQLTLAENTEIKNLCFDLVISQSSSSRLQAYVRRFNCVMYTKHKWLSGCAKRSAVLSVVINHVIILVPAIP